MSRWKVDRRVLPYPQGAVIWAACCDGEKRTFLTWREAFTFADKQARTREVVLPRPQLNEDGCVEFDFTEWSGLNYTSAWPGGATYDRRTGPNIPAFGANVPIPRERWKPLALALLALAEKENNE